VRVALIDGEWRSNPTFEEAETATFDVVVAGRRNEAGTVDILMIEGEAPDDAWNLIQEGATAPTEEVVAEGLEAAKRAIDEMIGDQLEFLAEVGVRRSRSSRSRCTDRTCSTRCRPSRRSASRARSCPARPSARQRSGH
jgi:polyribonucleotide nucleotidyltransferase